MRGVLHDFSSSDCMSSKTTPRGFGRLIPATELNNYILIEDKRCVERCFDKSLSVF